MALKYKSHELNMWHKEKNKDDDKYYANPEFRRAYMEEIMVDHADACSCMIRGPVEDLIGKKVDLLTTARVNSPQQPWGAVSNQPHAESFINPAGITLRILSLGCGPGTDLLAAIKACANIRGVQRLECFGVDKYPWPTERFYKELSVIQANSATRIDGQLFLYLSDSAQFIHDCIRLGIKFDLVISCYARARDRCEFFGSSVPRVLSEFGRIFVIDNKSDDLKSGLKAKGFRIITDLPGDGKPIFLEYKKIGSTNVILVNNVGYTA